MRKVIKIIFSILSSIILISIIVPIMVTLLLFLPPIQNLVVKQVTNAVSQKLETKVSVDKIHLRLFSRVVLDGLYVEDYQGDTLLYAKRIDAEVLSLALIKGRFTLGQVNIKGIKLNLIEEQDGTTNLRKVTNKLKRETPSEKKTIFRLRASGLNIEQSYFKHTKQSIKDRVYGVNFDDIEVLEFSVDLNKILVRGDSITARINKIALVDKSGLIVNSLSSKEFAISGAGIYLNDMKIDMPDSKIAMDYLKFHTGTWKGYREFTKEVKIESKMNDMMVSFRSIAYFAPNLKEWQTTVYNVNGEVSGTIANMSGELLGLRIGETGRTKLSMQFSMKGIPDIENTLFDFDVKQLTVAGEDVQRAVADVSGKQLSGEMIDKLDRLKIIEMVGQFNGTLSDFDANAKLYTEEGLTKCNLRLKPTLAGETSFDGRIDLEDMSLNRVFNNNKLGKLSVTAGVNGRYGAGELSLNTNAEFSKIEYNDYLYHDISMNGYVENRLFRGNIGSNDPNLKFDFDGLLNFNDTIPHYDFNLDLFNANLVKLNLNKRDSVSIIQTRVNAAGSGTTLDELNGRVFVSDMFYVNQMDSTRTGSMTIVGENDGRDKHLSFRSSFADVDYRSRTSYMKVLEDLQTVLHHYVPTLTPPSQTGEEEEGIPDAISKVDNYSLLNINIKEANNIAGIFLPGLVIASGSKLSFMLNSQANRLALSVGSDYIEYGDNFISQLDLNSRNQGDSISLFLRSDDLYLSGLYLPNFSVIGSLRQNNMNMTMRVLDQKRELSAQMGITSIFRRDQNSGVPQMSFRFTPSYIKSKGEIWNIFAREITVDSTKVDVDNLMIYGTNQQLRVNGRLGKSVSDTLKVSLSKFALNPISQLTSRLGYQMDGMATGYANVVSGMKNRVVHARVNFDSVTVNKVRVPDGYFESSWEPKRERAKLMLLLGKERESRDTVIRGYYNPKDGHYIADVRMNDIDLTLLTPLLGETLKEIQGRADAKINVAGVNREMKFNGSIDVSDFSARVGFTNVPYRVPSAPIEVKDNRLLCRSATVYDPQGSTAKLDMTLNLMSLSNVGYDFEVRHNNLLALNTTKKENSLFYGKVFASGHTRIRGDKGRVDLEVTATTVEGSEFYLPLNDEATMGVSDIITFRSPEELRVDSTSYKSRREMILSRKEQTKELSTRANLNLKMNLNVTPDLDFQLLIDPRVGDILRGKGAGSLTLNVNPLNDEFSIYGDYEIQQGTYQFTLQDIISKKFTIEDGSKIVWTGDPADALLDVTAVYKLKASLAPILGNVEQYARSVPVECRVMLGDRLSQPSVKFNVSVQTRAEEATMVANELATEENMATQFFFLLAANSFYPTANIGSIGTSAGGSAMFDILANQISNIISNDRFDVGFRYRPKDDLGSDEFNLDISTQLFSNRLILEMEGNYDRGGLDKMNPERASTITGDFYITWLIDKNGNLKAKGFTRTIDRFDENQGLQESGLGLYYREDFNTLKDIRENFKARFSSEKRKAKRAVKREKKEQGKREKKEQLGIREEEQESFGEVVDE